MPRLRTPRLSAGGAGIVGIYLAFVGLSLLQQPGRTTYDTRLELTERPGSFLASAFSLWQPDVNLGEVQNQANGYLFPQGPFFWLGDVLNVTPWVTQRLWSALVVIAACEGMRRLGRALDLPASAAFLGGLVFAFSPRLIGTSGVLTAEALPGALAPWACLPLLLAARRRLDGRTAIVLGAAVAVAMGGVNAVETGAALVPAGVLALWLAGQRLLSWRFVAGWAALVVVATLWWTVPLLVLGRYSPPFYEYVESAATTTAFVGWSEAIRGDTHWLSWTILPDGRPWWPAAHQLATDGVLVVVSALVAAAGLVGLARWRSRYRVPFAFSAAIGLAVLTVAHGGWAGTPLAPGARSALDGVLQIFRNVHKFDPSVRIALAVGVAALFGEVAGRISLRSSPGAAARWVVVPACVVLVLGAPYLSNNSRTPGWSEFPASWTQARDWLADHADNRAVLVLPASGFALQPWGATFDEPALALDVHHRLALTQAPLLPGQTLRFLSALNASLTSGRAMAVSEELARAGIGYVLLRGDLDPVRTGSPTPALAQSALESAGIEKVAGFGGDGVAPLTLYEVGQRLPALRATPADEVMTVAGAPESALPLEDTGLVDGSFVLKGEPGWQGPVDVVTDGAQRRERQFGSLYGALSVVLQAGEPNREKRAAHDYPGAPDAHQVVAAYTGLSSLRASSSRGYADTFGEVVTSEGPAAAIDADAGTRWVSSPATRPTRQWIRMTFSAPRPVHEVTIRPVIGDIALAPLRKIEVEAGARHQTLTVSPDGAPVVARFDGRPVASVAVRIREVGTARKRAPVALATVRVDDLVPQPTLRVPDPLGPDTDFLFHTEPGARPCVSTAFGPDCDESRRRSPEEPTGLDRTFEVDSGDSVGLGGLVVARTTRRALRLLEPVGREQRISASSVFGHDPRASSRFAWDGSDETAWVPADGDAGPTLLFRWSRPHVVSGIRVASPDIQTAPRRALVTTREGEQLSVRLDGSAPAVFPSVRTRSLAVTFQRPAENARLVVDEVQLDGVDITQPFDRDAPTGAVCGLGPHIVLDGVVHQSKVQGTLGDVVDGRPLRLTACDVDDPAAASPDVRLAAGEHRLRAPPTPQFQTVTVTGSSDRVPSATPARRVAITSWHGTRRTAAVGPGSATVVSMPSNANPGWTATLDGRMLQSIRVDGWQQGWVLPAGAGGKLVIDFPLQHWYGALLAAGLVPAGVVVLAALVLLLVPRRPAAPPPPPPAVDHRRTAAALTGLLVLALGVACAVGAIIAWIGRRRSWPIALGGLAVLASGLLDARDAAAPGDGVADLLAAAGFGILLVSAVVGRPGEEE